MKRILLTVLISLVFLVPGYTENGIPADAKKPETSICPKTKRMDCTTCHVGPDNSLKEKHPDANRDFPYRSDMKVVDDGKTAVLYLTHISSDQVAMFFDYVNWHPEIEKCTIEIHSPGGSLLEAWRIIGLMEAQKLKMVVETRVHGMAFSAGLIIFANGTKGSRLAAKQAEIMWHELITFSMFKISRPADVEDEAVILRHLQNTGNHFLAARSYLTVKQWNEKVYKKEFWFTGEEALKIGISDGYPK